MGTPEDLGLLSDPASWIDLPVVQGGRGVVWDWARLKWPDVIPHVRRTLTDGRECLYVPAVVYDALEILQPGAWLVRDATTRALCLDCLADWFRDIDPDMVEASRRLGGRQAMRRILPWATKPPLEEGAPWGEPHP